MMERISIDDGERIRQILDELEEEEDLEEQDNLEILSDFDDSDEDPDFSPNEEEIDLIEEIRNIEAGNKKRKKDSDGKVPKKKKNNETNVSPASVTKEQTSFSALLVPENNEFIGKNGFQWRMQPIKQVCKTKSKNIVHIRPGPTKNTNPDPVSCLELFLTEDIIDEMILRTNEEMERQRQNYKIINSTLRDTCNEEFRAFVGLLILAAVLKDNHLSAKLLFDSDYCGDRYRATLSRERFLFLTYCLRFDDRETREERRAQSKLAPIKEVWGAFVSNCTENYKPSSYCTIDEQLVGFRGRCPFRVYMNNKSNKYGLKIVMICDNATKYMIKAIPYLGKGTTPEGVAVADHFVQLLVDEMRGTNRNITMDNWFVSVPLVTRLREDYGLTVVGTIKKTKEIFHLSLLT